MNVNISRKLSNKKSAGQGMSEYLVIVGLIAVVGIGAMGLMGGSIRQTLAAFASEMAGDEDSSDIQDIAQGTAVDASAAAVGSLRDYSAANQTALTPSE